MNFSLIFMFLNTLIFSFGIDFISAQNSNVDYCFPILNDTVLKPGVYLSFDDFLNNNPSIDTSFHLTKDGKYQKIAFDDRGIKLFCIDSDGKKKRFRDMHWGFCNGRGCYINYDGNHFINISGVLCLYSVQKRAVSGGYVAAGPGGGGMVVTGGVQKSTKDFVIDLRTGNVLKVDYLTIRELIRDNSELLFQFENEKGRKRKALFYLFLYNRSFNQKTKPCKQ